MEKAFAIAVIQLAKNAPSAAMKTHATAAITTLFSQDRLASVNTL
jgi:hypothetical protein